MKNSRKKIAAFTLLSSFVLSNSAIANASSFSAANEKGLNINISGQIGNHEFNFIWPSKPGNGNSSNKPGNNKPGNGNSSNKPGNGNSSNKPGNGNSSNKPAEDIIPDNQPVPDFSDDNNNNTGNDSEVVDETITIDLSAEELYGIAYNAYIYGLPIIELEASRYDMTHASSVNDTEWAPLGQFYHIREFATADTTTLRAPNIDVLYSGAWVTLEDEPMIVYVPEVTDRYYSIQINDMYSNISGYIGTRETGTGEGFYALVGPDFEGEIDADVNGIIEVSTNYTWVFPRTYSAGGDDLEATYAVQDAYNIIPLSAYKELGYASKDYEFTQDKNGIVDITSIPYGEVQFFEYLNTILQEIGLAANETELEAQLDSIGLGPNVDYSKVSYTDEQLEKLQSAAADAQNMILAILNNTKTPTAGWTKGGSYIGKWGTGYFMRAICALGGIGGNTIEEALYMNAYFDSNAERLNGTNSYEFTFDPESLPEVGAFWSVTAYNSSTNLLIPNALGRYALKDSEPYQYNEDGTVTIYVSSECPEGLESNWLPVQDGEDFHLIFRAYVPSQGWLEDSFTLPALIKNTK